MTKTPQSPQPIILTPVYFSPSTTVSIISPSALLQSNPYFNIQIDPNVSITFRLDNNITYLVPIFHHDTLPYTSLPVYYLCTQDIVHEGTDDYHLTFTDEDDSPTIASLSTNLPIYNPILHQVIDTKGHVNINTIDILQCSILNSYPLSSFWKHRTVTFHLDSGANVHATNNYYDFVIFHKINSKIHLADRSTAHCKGIGAILTQLTPSINPVIIDPVYYCPTAKLSTLSPSSLKHYNKFNSVTIQVHHCLHFYRANKDTLHTLSITPLNHLDYVALPILHLTNNDDVTPTLASFNHINANNQHIHQKFNHRNMYMIIKMQKHKMMSGIPSKINKFHNT